MLINSSIRSLFLIAFAGILLCGCSGNSSQPVSPDNPESLPELTVREETDANSDGTNHYLMHSGYIFIDPYHPDGPQFEVVPVRQGEFHLNILKYLEISPCADCFKVVGLDIPNPGKLNVDIQIDHPFDQLEFSVFDVRAIMMFNGSHEFPVCGKSTSDPALGDGAVLNPDGYTALYNGSTITAPVGDLQKYFPGKLAAQVVPDSDINGYKYFITDVPSNYRNAFYAGSSDVQTFELQCPDGTFVIGYAVDASWWPPISSPVDDPLSDFDKNANCTEPYKVVVTEEKFDHGLTIFGGLTRLIIDVYDWQGKSTYYAPIIECPELFNGTKTATSVIGGFGYSRYEVIISNDNLAPIGNYMCLIRVEAIENNPTDTPWLDLTAYQCCHLKVTEGEPGGDLIWAKQGGGSVYSYSIAALSDNSIVMNGSFYGSATIGQGEPNETVLNSAGSFDIFIARYNPDGSLVWARHAGGTEADYAGAIAAFPDDSTVVTGTFDDSATFGEGEPNETVLTAEWLAGPEIFIARYNPDGSLAWAKQAGGYHSEDVHGVTTLSDDSFVVTGDFYQSTTFGEGEPNETKLVAPAGGYPDIFIARYDPGGTLAWANQAGGTGYDKSWSITTLSDNSTVLTGGFYGSATFGQGDPNETVLYSESKTDIFVARYNPDGSLAWAKQASGILYDYGYGVTTLSDDSTVVTGYFSASTTFGPGEPGETVLITLGHKDIFIARYNPDGSFVWAKQAGGTGEAKGISIIALSDNSTAITGWFVGSVIFGQGEPKETVHNSAGETEEPDIFSARYNPDGSLDWAVRAGGIKSDQGRSITALSDNTTIVTGIFEDSAIFGKDEPNETILDSPGSRCMFIARLAE